MQESPFAPTFGSWPPVLAGRSDLEDEFGVALQTGPRHEWYTTLLVGNRGTGKTVALYMLADVAATTGHHVIYDVAQPGLPQRLASALDDLEGPVPKRRTKLALKLGIPGASITASSESTPRDEDQSLNLRGALSRAVERTTASGAAGIVLVVDELHDAEPRELGTLGAAIQIVTRMNGAPVPFVGAGLPSLDDLVLDSKGTTFLERCARYDTGSLSNRDTRLALESPFSEGGVTYDAGGMSAAVAASAGHPFAIQSIGHHAWDLHDNPAKPITARTFDRAIDKAMASMGRQVAQPIWKRLSAADRDFVAVMASYAADDVPVDHLRTALGKSRGWVSRYRDRLIKAGVIRPAKRGYVTFAHPAFQSWLRDHQVDERLWHPVDTA